jgi:hypothetical protein
LGLAVARWHWLLLGLAESLPSSDANCRDLVSDRIGESIKLAGKTAQIPTGEAPRKTLCEFANPGMVSSRNVPAASSFWISQQEKNATPISAMTRDLIASVLPISTRRSNFLTFSPRSLSTCRPWPACRRPARARSTGDARDLVRTSDAQLPV